MRAVNPILRRLQDRLPGPGVGADTPLTEAAPDSIDAVELLCTVDEEFGVRLTEEEFLSCRYLSELAQKIEQKMAIKNHDVR